MDIEELAREFEAENQNTVENTNLISVEKNEVAEQTDINPLSANSVVVEAQKTILQRAKDKIVEDKILEKHAKKIADITDKAIKVDADRAALNVAKQDADNKTDKQEIKNKLIVLKAEASRLKKEQKQLNREQRADHKARNKEAAWQLYSGKLTKMKYDYVPNKFILSMLLFFDGMKSFFDGLGTVSTAIVKALKWVLLVGAIAGILFAIPATREWLINLLK